MTTCRAAVIDAPGATPTIADVDVPDLEPGGMLVQVEAATLCGTDVHFWHADVAGGPDHPYIPGHETSGRIVELAGTRRDVTGRALAPGDRVIWTYPFCRQCFYCSSASAPTLCSDMVRFGRARSDRFPYLLGGCAEYHYVPPGSEVVVVPDEVPAALAAAASCSLRTVMHAFERVGEVTPRTTVLVQGCGAVGLFAAAVARDRGAGRVLVVGDPAGRHQLARRLGADDAVDLSGSAAQRREWVLAATGGRGADIVLECASAAAVSEGLDLVRPGGHFVAIGGGGTANPIPPAILAKTLAITSIRGGEGRHYASAIEFLAGRPLEPYLDLFEEPFALDATGAALDAIARLEQPKPVIRVA